MRKARSRSRCRNTATRSISRTADDDDEPSALRPSRCCRTSSCRRREIRHRVRSSRDVARDSNRTRANSRDTRTRGCRWTSVGMRDYTLYTIATKFHVLSETHSGRQSKYLFSFSTSTSDAYNYLFLGVFSLFFFYSKLENISI